MHAILPAAWSTGHIKVIVQAALLLVLVLLYRMFGNLTDGLLVLSRIPLALTAEVIALWARDILISISAAVGLIASSCVLSSTMLTLLMLPLLYRLAHGTNEDDFDSASSAPRSLVNSDGPATA